MLGHFDQNMFVKNGNGVYQPLYHLRTEHKSNSSSTGYHAKYYTYYKTPSSITIYTEKTLSFYYDANTGPSYGARAVSYTHLTLQTIYSL